jgi:phosphoribosylaminoimidazolecarboxamide formyltransferase/IMP cyclohydrolase
MVRAAAKNHGNEAGGVGIVTDPADYAGIVAELKANGGALSYKTRFDLARKAFTHTARYDAAISNHLTALADDGSKMAYPERFQLAFDKVQDLRYGENPHQSAAFYRESSAPPAPSPPTPRCRARSCRTTTSPTPTRPGNASRPSTAWPA